MRRTLSILALVLFAATVQPIAALLPRVGVEPSVLARSQPFVLRAVNQIRMRELAAIRESISPSAESPRTHWKRGALIGGVLSAALLYGFVFDDLRGGYRVVASVGVAAIVGWIPGALIGGQFPRDE